MMFNSSFLKQVPGSLVPCCSRAAEFKEEEGVLILDDGDEGESASIAEQVRRGVEGAFGPAC